MPTALTSLYCSPQDVYEQIGVEAAQLRLDDQNQSSGQQIATTSDSIAGSTSIAVSALQYGLLSGTKLVFSDANMTAPVEATLTSVASTGATSLTVSPLSAEVNIGAVAFDNGVNVWLGGMLAKACSYATDRINVFCLTRYPVASLATSWTVNQYAVVIAVKWIATRLFRAAPEQIKDAYEETMEELKAIQASEMNLPLAPNTSQWPFMSNVTIDLGYTVRKVRVEPTISEPTPTQYPQAVDYSSYFLLEW